MCRSAHEFHEDIQLCFSTKTSARRLSKTQKTYFIKYGFLDGLCIFNSSGEIFSGLNNLEKYSSPRDIFVTFHRPKFPTVEGAILD